MKHTAQSTPANKFAASAPRNYEAPKVESVITSEQLEREAFYAGSQQLSPIIKT